jgi:wobble nucleotide-excising tRNase
MLNKIERLISVGKFRNYNTAGPVNFGKLTTIFGDNGGGKTTLTAVLRSLTQDDPALVRSRISTNHTAPQAAQISYHTAPGSLSNHTFGTNGWTAPLPDIEIFDVHFVNDNVYSGFEFTDDHKKQLHKFVIGAPGVAIQQQIDQNKTDKTNLRQAIQTLEQQIVTQVGNGLVAGQLTQFLNTRPTAATGIDQAITDAQAALSAANSNAIINTLPSLTQLPGFLPNFDFAQLITDLTTTTQTIQDSALSALFESHCNHLALNNLESPELWLKDGFGAVQNQIIDGMNAVPCPFCKQDMALSLDIVKAYTIKFDEAFSEFVETISQHITNSTQVGLQNLITNINTICSTNNNYVASWSTHLPASAATPINNIIADVASLTNAYAGYIAAVQLKGQNPTVTVDTTSINDFQDLVSSINQNITAYNLLVSTYNGEIITFKAGIQTVAQAQAEVSRLTRIKMRFEPAIVTLCTQLTTGKQRLDALESSYTQLSQQQASSATASFSLYKNQVNHYLRDVFRTHFLIDDVVHVAPQGQARVARMGYKLVIDGQDISFAADQPFSVKQCLSEGDKTTIALAFFLSKLDIDANKANKILVFDDPLSSLDTNRRTYTTRLIRDLIPVMKQVVVLSHSEIFLHEISDKVANADKKSLRITEDFVAKASKIEVCNLTELVKNDYFKHLEKIENFRSNPDHSQKDYILGLLRNVLESHLNFKFYRPLRTLGGDHMFGRVIDHLNNQQTLNFREPNKALVIGKLQTINSVSWKPHHGTAQPNYSQTGFDPNTLTAAELDNLIVDTLNLIDHQL